jgi:hypothetical protein
LLLSVSVLIESHRLGIGTPRNPGMGFLAFGASGLLGILSLILFLQTFLGKEEAKSEPLFSGRLWKRVLVVLMTLVVYSNLMPLIGYLISTFFLMFLLLWILESNRMRWFFWSLIISFLTTTITYYIFSILLKCEFPAGLFGL